MKKLVLILSGMALTTGLLATAGFVYAMSDNPPEVETQDEMPDGRGMFAGRGMQGPGWFGEGVLGEYIFPALADLFDLSDGQVEDFEIVRDTLKGLHEEYSFEEIREKMEAAFSTALDDAIADRAITQEEADEILERKQQFKDRDFPGDFNRFDGRSVRENMPMMGREDGVLDEYMDAAMADALGVSVEELQEMKEDGLNLRDHAEENDLSGEELAELMKDVHTSAVNAALEDGAITQEQADFMLSMVGFGGRLPFDPGVRGMSGDWNEGETD